MKSRALLSVLLILLILILTGCGMIPPGFPDWAMAEETVYQHWQAIINRQYGLAKHYYIPDGFWYNKTDKWEEYINANSGGEASVLIYFYHFYEQTEVIGNNAIVYAKFSLIKYLFLVVV
jgi:predicted small lipoprotein YifL